MQPSITAQQQLRLTELWCCSAGPQGVLACQHLQSSRDRAEKPVHHSVPWSLVLWAFSKHHWLDWDHPAPHYSPTQIQFGFQIRSWELNYLHCIYTQCIVLSICKVSIWRCGHIYHWLAKFQKRNPVITKEIHTIRRFMWGQKKFTTQILSKLVRRIYHADQQRSSWFESDFCASSALCIFTLLTIDNGAFLHVNFTLDIPKYWEFDQTSHWIWYESGL